ncbi:MAG: citramalate synthase [Conexibacter sp.]
MTTIELYDTTLRDGMQGEGMSLSAEEKLRVALRLDELGIHLIEAGFPSSNPKELALFDMLAGESFTTAEIAAFGMTRRRGVRAEEDEALRVLADCVAPVVTLVGKTWGLHVEKVVKVDRDENLHMIEESIAFLLAQGKRVIYDAEHFFDGWRDDPAYALRCLRAAVGAGAETVVPCDTNGASLPGQIAMAMADVVAQLADTGVQVGVHCHNDAECGVANSLAAVEAGATHVQGTMNGYGERCGNANLVSIVPNLQLKLGYDCLPAERLATLTETAHFVDELLNRSPHPDQPYVGKNAFAHGGGMHADGVAKDPSTFEHIDPALVGNANHILISEVSGKAAVRARAEEAGLALDDAAVEWVLARVKQRENEGFQFEAADGSFHLLMLEAAHLHDALFALDSWTVTVNQNPDGKVVTEATVRLRQGEGRESFTADGNGPLNALDRALRLAIVGSHPHLDDVRLVNFKVRILDETKGTEAVTRVLLDAADEEHVWGSIGVSENIIKAAWDALVDSLEYAEQRPQPRLAQATDAAGGA